MKVIITCSEALDKVFNWVEFCEEVGISEWCVNEGFGHTEINIDLDIAIKYGLINETN